MQGSNPCSPVRDFGKKPKSFFFAKALIYRAFKGYNICILLKDIMKYIYGKSNEFPDNSLDIRGHSKEATRICNKDTGGVPRGYGVCVRSSLSFSANVIFTYPFCLKQFIGFHKR